jgi:molybdate transport system substrate-binding protein
MIRALCLLILLAFTPLAVVPQALASQRVAVAVSTNFLTTAEELSDAFTAASGTRVALTSGVTGKLSAQITQGAPFDVFLSADATTPERLAAEGHALADRRFTYAFGRLALHARDPALLAGGDLKAALEAPGLRFLAIANPDLAPYGRAAMEVLEEFALVEALEGRLALGQNVGQAFALVDSGAADIGLVALSSVIDLPPETHIVVPEGMHAPIRQDAILLKRGDGNAGAAAFLEFLKSPQAAAIMQRHGYEAGQ